ncbi:tetratricopeptide repeat protein [Kibdelosporangium philippinense]|uniref:Tetratricopeptide repeat protein n=1 Tax=Kibdelosporangium philippinense TaxID=211113 RepID=A0ABS8ZGD9_9PSEU|nr:BTAD domain-containing putative transcriptional regulator [Kibdelosporangium philippinense]MCE7006891.1 tetratricopeptide repeat protein [Kibdelosporangium philippinense]
MLGPVTAWRGTQPVGLGTSKCRQVLGMLLLHANRRVDREQIIEGAWGSNPPRSAVNLVQKYVGDVRRALELDGDSLVTVGTGYLLRVAPDQLDSTQFASDLEHARETKNGGDLDRARQTLADAMALWRGPAFSGIDTPTADTERARLDEYRIGALEDIAELDLLRDNHALAVAELSRLASEHPYRERVRELLMIALYRSGRQADALAVYQDIQRLLADELGTNPGHGLQRVHAQILRADPALSEGAAPREPESLPVCQLPADIPDFTGRAEQLEDVLGLLTGGRNAVIVGAPGTGKSTLAVRAAHLAREMFPDGQLYLDLAGTADVPRDTAMMLAELLRALGVTDAVMPDGLHERAALYRSRLAGRQMLVLLDDAAGAHQVRPLLPPSTGCAALVTSRHLLGDLTSAHHVELDVLPSEDARALLAGIVGSDRTDREPEQAVAIVERCGRLPLAIRIAGARLASRQAWTLQVLQDRLEDESRRLCELRVGDLDLRANFDLSVRMVPADSARAFRLMGLLGAETLPGWVIGALIDQHDADDVLDALVDANLVRLMDTDSVGQPRYRLHDLLRAYAAKAAEEHYPLEERRAAVERVLGAWLALTEQARDLFYPSLFEPTRGAASRWQPVYKVVDPIAWFDVERGRLLHAIQLAVDWDLDELAWELAVAAVPYYDHRSLYQDWIRSHRIALTSRTLRGEAALLQSLGQVHIYLDEDAKALRALKRSVQLHHEAGDKRGSALALAGLATMRRVHGNYDLALGDACAALNLCVEVGHQHMEAQLRSAIGLIRLIQGNLDEAKEWIDSGLAVARQLRDRHRQAVILRNSSKYFQQADDTPAALRCLTKALTIFKDLNDERCAAYTEQRVGNVYAQLDDHPRARYALQRAADVFYVNADRRNEAECWQQLGELDVRHGELDAARTHLGRALELWQAIELADRAAAVEIALQRIN